MPGFVNKKVTQPVFIISNPRSGTTYLHRLMSLDTQRFISMKQAHTFFPSAIYTKLLSYLHSVDKNTGNHLSRLISKIDNTIYKGWEGVHNMGFNKTEEDEALFAFTMYSPGIFVLFPGLQHTRECGDLDHEPENIKNSVMAFYHSGIQRFLHGYNSNKTYLAKNVMSSGRIESLLKIYPDAKFIYIYRDPVESLPSFASMFGMMYQYHSPFMKTNDPNYREWIELGIFFYQHNKSIKNKVPKDQYYSISYKDLTTNTFETIKGIYQNFEWETTSAFLETLQKDLVHQTEFKSKNKYTLEEYGYTQEEIRSRVSF